MLQYVLLTKRYSAPYMVHSVGYLQIFAMYTHGICNIASKWFFWAGLKCLTIRKRSRLLLKITEILRSVKGGVFFG